MQVQHFDAMARAMELAGARLRADQVPPNPFANLAERMLQFGASRADGLVMDASQAHAFQRELEHLSATVHLTVFAELTAEAAFPLAPDQPPPGAESYAWPEVEVFGGSSGTGYGDLGGAGEFTRAKNSSPVRVYTAHYGFDVGDQQRSQLTGQPLSALKGIAAKRIIAQDMNSDVWNGNSNLNIPGVLSNTSITKNAVANGAGGSPLWANKESDEIQLDVNKVVTAIIAAIKGNLALKSNRLGLPPSRFAQIAQMKRATGTDTTVLEYLLMSLKAISPDFQITEHPEMETGAGDGTKAWFMVYRFDPMIAGRVMALPFSELAPQLSGFQTVIPCHAQAGGVVVFKPLAMQIGYGI